MQISPKNISFASKKAEKNENNKNVFKVNVSSKHDTIDTFDKNTSAKSIKLTDKITALGKKFINKFKGQKQLVKSNEDNIKSKNSSFEELKKTEQDSSEIKQIKEVSMHHDINGQNITIRRTIRDIENDAVKDAFKISNVLEKIYKIDKEFSELSPTDEDCIVYRGRSKHLSNNFFNTDFKIVENANPGDIIVPDSSYSYCAVDYYTASIFSCGDEKLMYKIKIPKGAKVSRNDEHGGEVIMPRGAQYKLLSKTKDYDGTQIVTMEYILPEKDNLEQAKQWLDKYDIEL